MEKYANFKNASRSCLGLILFFLTATSQLYSAVLLDKQSVVTSEPFSFVGLDTVSFYGFAPPEFQINLNSLLKEVAQNRVNVILSEKTKVNANALIAKVLFYIDLEKIEGDLFLLSMQAVVSGTTAADFRGKMPVYGRNYVIKTGKNAQSEINEQIKTGLRAFISLYAESNGSNLTNVIFYVGS